MKKGTAAWVKKAEDDYRLAVLAARGRGKFHDAVCFHCQQAAEKYLKAMLHEFNSSIPRIHDLLQLVRLLLAIDATLNVLWRALRTLNRYAVEYRYPGVSATGRQANAALRWAGLSKFAGRAALV